MPVAHQGSRQPSARLVPIRHQDGSGPIGKPTCPLDDRGFHRRSRRSRRPGLTGAGSPALSTGTAHAAHDSDETTSGPADATALLSLNPGESAGHKVSSGRSSWLREDFGEPIPLFDPNRLRGSFQSLPGLRRRHLLPFLDRTASCFGSGRSSSIWPNGTREIGGLCLEFSKCRCARSVRMQWLPGALDA